MKLVKCDYCSKIIDAYNAKYIDLSVYENNEFITHIELEVCGECYYKFSRGQLPNMKGRENERDKV